MDDALSLTLPKALGRSRRRRLPRPPKFTRWQKFWIAFFTVCIVVDVASGYVTTVPGVTAVAAYAGIIRVEFMAGLHGDGWRRTRDGEQARRVVNYALLVAFLTQLLHSVGVL